MRTIFPKPGSFGFKAAFLAGSDRSGSTGRGAPRLVGTGGTVRQGGLAARIWAVLRCWQERSESRRHLRSMEDRILQDVGLTRADFDREIAKPFWRP